MLKVKQRPRIYYTEEQKALMWDRWQKGESLGSKTAQSHLVSGLSAAWLSRY